MSYEKIGINTKNLVDATEWFTTLMYFLHEEREQKGLTLKIGTFAYDDWESEIYCVLEDNNGLADIYFTETRDDREIKIVGGTTKIKRLTDLCFGWAFDEAIIYINFDMIHEFRKLLTAKEDNIFDAYYDEVHCDFW